MYAMNPYSFFDDIVCINLKSRDDRYIYAKDVFTKYNIPARIERFDRSSYGGIYGCFDSHMKVIRDSYEKGMNQILIFEDDLKPTDAYSLEHIQNAVNFMRKNDKWDMFYFGFFVINMHADFMFFANANKNNANIMQYKGLGTHSYCISRNGMSKVLETYEPFLGKEHVDIYFSRRSSLVTYSYIPILFDQKFCFKSDIEPKNMTEKVLRHLQCEIERKEVNYRISLSTLYFMKHYKCILCFTGIILFVTAMTVILYWKHSPVINL